MSELSHKGYARIYVPTVEDVQKVKDVIKEIDEFEFDYLPNDLIAPFSEYPALAYTHKFSDMDMNKLTAICWSRGIHIFVCDNGLNESMNNALVTYCQVCGKSRPWNVKECQNDKCKP